MIKKIIEFINKLLDELFGRNEVKYRKKCNKPPIDCRVFVGGVAGLDSIQYPRNSEKYRIVGGDLYLHGVGWGRLTIDERKKILDTFKKANIGIEVGFGTGYLHDKAWANRLQDRYLELGINPFFITSNAFGKGNVPTFERWNEFSNNLRSESNLDDEALILPTLEYANFSNDLKNNHIRDNKIIKSIVDQSKGFVLDSPPEYYFNRNNEYREWCIDLIKYGLEKEYTAAWIISPHFAGKKFDVYTYKLLCELRDRDVIPSVIVVENYNAKDDSDYVNVVGNENKDDTCIGIAWDIVNEMFPNLNIKFKN